MHSKVKLIASHATYLQNEEVSYFPSNGNRISLFIFSLTYKNTANATDSRMTLITTSLYINNGMLHAGTCRLLRHPLLYMTNKSFSDFQRQTLEVQITKVAVTLWDLMKMKSVISAWKTSKILNKIKKHDKVSIPHKLGFHSNMWKVRFNKQWKYFTQDK